MKIKTTLFLTILTPAIMNFAHAQSFTTNTLSFSGASWNDGGSLNGNFTVEYENGTPTELLSLDVTTGNGTSDGFTGYDFLYNVAGQADTVFLAGINATEGGEFAANEVVADSDSGGYRNIFLDWQGTTPTSLYLGDVGGEFSSEYDSAVGITRGLNTDGGSVGTVPEPSSFALAGLGGIVTWVASKRKRSAK